MGQQHYTGSCQCGAVRYAVDVNLDSTVTCNCSRCRRLGTIMAFAPESRFTLEAGEDSLTSYRFNTHHIEHLFCRLCGIQPFSRAAAPDGTPTVAVNARCLDGVDPDALTPTRYDGASR